MVKGSWLMIMTDSSLEERLQSFMECEGKSCSFDPEAIVVHGLRFMVNGFKIHGYD